MTSDVKLSQYFLLIKVNKLTRVHSEKNTQIIEKIISKHHPLCEYRETSTFEHISQNTVFISI